MWGRPDILWGLIALAIPVALHLLQLRRFKRVPFSNVSFLRDVQKETKSRHRLRNLLILAFRMLAFAALILAFADPMQVPENAVRASQQSISVYVDTSPSMMATGETGPLIQEAKQKATALVEAFNETDKFHVFTSDFDGQDQRFLTQTEALERIASIQLSSSAPELGAVVQRSLDQFRRNEGASSQAFWITDLQKTSHDPTTTSVPDTSVSWHVLPCVPNDMPNVWIDSVWFDAPLALSEQPALLHVRIDHNASEGVDGLPLMLSVDGVKEAIGSFNLVPGIPTDTVLRFTHGEPGPHALEVALEDAPVRFDDIQFVGYDVEDAVQVFHWTHASQRQNTTDWIDQAFQSAKPLVAVDRGSELPASHVLATYDLVVADAVSSPSLGAASLLAQFVANGGTALLIPDSAASGISSLTTPLGLGTTQGWVRQEGRVDDVRWNHPLYKGVFRSTPSRVDWPSYDRILNRRMLPKEEMLASASNGLCYLSMLRGTEGRGDVYLLSTPLETGSFARHGLFVPTILRMAESARSTTSMSMELGRDQALTLTTSADSTLMREREVSWRIVPTESQSAPIATQIVPESRSTPEGVRLGWGNSLNKPGSYVVQRNGEKLAVFGLNHATSESDLDVWEDEEWLEQLASFHWPDMSVWTQRADQVAGMVEKHIAGERLAWYFILLALLALGVETILLRRWKNMFS